MFCQFMSLSGDGKNPVKAAEIGFISRVAGQGLRHAKVTLYHQMRRSATQSKARSGAAALHYSDLLFCLEVLRGILRWDSFYISDL